MITEDRAIQQLSLRSDLPRLSKEGFYLFAVLEGEEHREARLRIYHGAFAYFAGDDLRGVDSIDAAGATPLPG